MDGTIDRYFDAVIFVRRLAESNQVVNPIQNNFHLSFQLLKKQILKKGRITDGGGRRRINQTGIPVASNIILQFLIVFGNIVFNLNNLKLEIHHSCHLLLIFFCSPSNPVKYQGFYLKRFFPKIIRNHRTYINKLVMWF